MKTHTTIKHKSNDSSNGFSVANSIFISLGNRVIHWLEKIATQKNWLLLTALLCTTLSLFLSFPQKEIIFSDYTNVPEVVGLKQKFATPFSNIDVPQGSHQSKLTYRLTVPVLAHYTKTSFEFWKCIEILCGALMFYIAAALAYRLLNKNRVNAILTALLLSVIFAGTTSFIEFRGTFDGLAIFLLICGCYFTNPIFLFLITLSASFCDERALIASAFMVLFHSDIKTPLKSQIFALFNKKTIPIYIAWGIYFYIRFVVLKYMTFDMHGIHLRVPFEQRHNLCNGLWSAFEGGWLIILCALLVGFSRKKIWYNLAWCFTMTVSVIVAFFVIDITRSMAYLTPCLFIALKQLGNNPSSKDESYTQTYLLIAFIISLVWPSIFFGGNEAWWFAPPLPLSVLRDYVFCMP